MFNFTAEEEVAILKDAMARGFIADIKNEICDMTGAKVEVGDALFYYLMYKHKKYIGAECKLNKELGDYEYKIVGGYRWQTSWTLTYTYTYTNSTSAIYKMTVV